MPTNIQFCSLSGATTVDSIVEELVKQWPRGLKPFQREAILKILDQQHVLCITATGDGKSALFAIPILVHQEISKNPQNYPRFMIRIRGKPIGLVITPTKGLANNIVLELALLGITAFAYTQENIADAKREGRNIVKEITECQYQVICVDPEHLQDSEWSEILNSPGFRSNIIYACAEECHLVNEWGFDFRTAFQSIGSVFTSRIPPDVSRLALTATLQPGSSTSMVCKSLGFFGPRFHLTRRSNERPNTRIIVETLTSSIHGSEFPQLLPYLNDRRKTVIHAETKLLSHQIFTYLFMCLRDVQNPLSRIRMYNSGAPDGYNEKTVDLINNSKDLQVIIATSAFTNGMNAKALTDSICVKAASTQDGSEQRGGRVGRDGDTVGRRIILVTPHEFKKAQKTIEALPDDLNLSDGFPSSGKAKSSEMDPAKAYFLTERTCRIACINRIYQNPPVSQSGLDCIAAERPQPCDLCCVRHHIHLNAGPLLKLSNPSLPLFSPPPPSQPTRPKSKKDLTKKQTTTLQKALTSYEQTLWLEESFKLPHRNLSRSAYLPPSLVARITSQYLSIKKLADLDDLLSSYEWRFWTSQAAKLYDILQATRSSIVTSRKRKLKKKKDSDSEKENDEIEVEDDEPPPPPSSSRRTVQESSSSRKRTAQDDLPAPPRARRKPVESVAAAASAYRPAYKTDGRSRRARKAGDEENNVQDGSHN